jgi:hypothetical protein
MGQFARLSRSPGSDPARPGRGAGDYADAFAARLRKLAAAGSTGTLPFSGRGIGAIHFRDGIVVGAESAGTPAGPFSGIAGQDHGSADLDPATGADWLPFPGLGAARLGGTDGSPHASASESRPEANGTRPEANGTRPEANGTRPEANGTRPGAAGEAPAASAAAAQLMTALAYREPVLDAALDLLQSKAPTARFRSARGREHSSPVSLPVEELLTELARRRRLVRQLAALVTADTPVIRCPALHAPRAQVSAMQWALIIRAGAETTPRALAWAISRSVFGTTVEVHRLLTLRLLAAEATGSAEHLDREFPEHGTGSISFIRAVSD